MSDLNLYACTGRLGADVERRTFPDGSPVANFRLAITESWRKDGEKQERTLWMNVQITNKGICDIAEKYLSKGSRVAISGKLQSRSWEKDGAKQYVTELVIGPFGGSLTMMDNSPAEAKNAYKDAGPGEKSVYQSSGGYSGGGEVDDLPFAMEWR